MCECEGWKAQWLNQAFKGCIVFDDMKVLGSGRGKDAVTQQYHRVPKARKTENDSVFRLRVFRECMVQLRTNCQKTFPNKEKFMENRACQLTLRDVNFAL